MARDQSLQPPVDDQTIAIYSDYVCPFCFLGRESLYQYLDSTDDPPAVEWRFFDLRANRRGNGGELSDDVDTGKTEEYFERVRENVDQLSDRYDVEMDLTDARDVDSWNAQQAALYVKRNYSDHQFKAFHDAVFDALWQDGRDIEDPTVLADIATVVGISGEDIREAVDDDALAADLNEQFLTAKRAGITGIPTFVYGQHAARGAVPPAQLRRLVEGF